MPDNSILYTGTALKIRRYNERFYQKGSIHDNNILYSDASSYNQEV